MRRVRAVTCRASGRPERDFHSRATLLRFDNTYVRELQGDEGAAIVSGNAVPPGAGPIARAYVGRQCSNVRLRKTGD